MKVKVIVALCISGFLLMSCLSSNQLSSSLGAAGSLVKGLTVTKQDLVASARLSAEEMDKEAKVASSGSKYTKRLNRLTKNLRTYDDMKLNYKVYLSKDVNAFAMPDGTVRVYSGLMNLMNDDELMAVIGHEIGHVALEHSLAQYRKQYITNAARLGLAASGEKAAIVTSAFGDLGEEFVNAQFSQADELEADAYGVKVLKKLKRNPYAAVSAQKKLQKLGASGGLLSSHPSSETRIAKATEAADKVSGK
jgi:putative metalloprotease